jgi:hypothetical protein
MWVCSPLNLTDQDGKPIAGVPKHHIEPGGDARLIACRMVRNNRKGRGSHERASPTKWGKNIIVACWATNDSVFGRAVSSRILWDVILEGAGYGEGRGKAHAT